MYIITLVKIFIAFVSHLFGGEGGDKKSIEMCFSDCLLGHLTLHEFPEFFSRVCAVKLFTVVINSVVYVFAKV